MGWASWGLRAPWGLFNWHVGQEKTTCLIVIWKPVPLRTFLVIFGGPFPLNEWWHVRSYPTSIGGSQAEKGVPPFGVTPCDLLGPSLLALRVSPSVYEGVSGKLVHETKVETHIRSLFCKAALLAA